MIEHAICGAERFGQGWTRDTENAGLSGALEQRPGSSVQAVRTVPALLREVICICCSYKQPESDVLRINYGLFDEHLPPSPFLSVASFSGLCPRRSVYGLWRVAFSPAKFTVPRLFRFFSFLFFLLLVCLPGPLLLLGSGTASRVCARSRVAGRASLQRPALPGASTWLVLHAVPPSLPLSLPLRPFPRWRLSSFIFR